ncbi:MAG: MgtC/SapB family protein [Capsulimonadaceae bacterium]
MLPSALLHSPIVHDSGLLLLALLLGGLVGLDRELSEHPAGLRTHMLVCMGSALITVVSIAAAGSGGRIAAQIVSGIGFLGAGTILREANGSIVRGLTTAASLWVVAGIGIAVGYGGLYAELAAVATVLVLITLTILTRLELVIGRLRKRQPLTFIVAGDRTTPRIKAVLSNLHDLGVRTADLRLDRVEGAQVVHLNVWLPSARVRDQIKPLLLADPDIVNVDWSP